ncbi:tRNA guanosine-2'-O-methyltransferase TRM11 [Durotheca rogersii]|uniref:tRNA guanosine-2'-O-methyltransferase TRM11 n=1 Tax=Durotheca rogersii TaxID=419775 RepID=UPI002220945F|nr:tRNA guanosine-2'-O-methyltransferase TRM11 [Durotheca rogersii]KAI5867348.1 tRNA guanosine-2'-O-methyltransferase TRM11 [Durotheca rogersii]
MEYLIRFSQSLETFRLAEIQALAVVEGIDLEVISYSDESPFCLVRLPSEEAAKALLRRSILAQTIHEHWGTAETYDELHRIVKRETSHLWAQYKQASFKINIDAYQGSRSSERKLALINDFAYLPFDGLVILSSPDQEFTIFEQWEFDAVPRNLPDPLRIYFGRLVGHGVRELVKTYDLKKRGYISTTSMDSELALLTANIALAAPGKIFYDPFVGTGSFPIACAHFGAMGWGSDIDGRSVRGQGGAKSLEGNFKQYGLERLLGDVFVSDLTNSPMRKARILDGIVCDPPYGVREGLKVLGCRDPEKDAQIVEKGKRTYRNPSFVPPKKPYSFTAMLDDILNFASDMLVDHGRLSFWMPTANDEEQEIPVPTHPCLSMVVVCTQAFNKWSRRLITYRRLPDAEVDVSALEQRKQAEQVQGRTADDLNPFRRVYFRGFKPEQGSGDNVAS